MADLDQVIGQMAAAGLHPPTPLKVSGKIVRFGPKGRCWYVLHEFVARNGDRHVVGRYGDWRWGRESVAIETDWSKYDPAEVERMRREQEERSRREEEKRRERAKLAANRAAMQWQSGVTDAASPYLERKKVAAERGLRFFADGTLLVPMMMYAEDPARLSCLQKISPDGVKKFNKGGEVQGAACRLGTVFGDGQTLLLAEGVATALSLRLATGHSVPVYVAFNAGNLMSVARVLRKRYPNSPIVVAADDDGFTVCQRHQADGLTRAMPVLAPERPDWCRCNPGVHDAYAVTKSIEHAFLLAPMFVDPRRDEGRWTDWNDLHVFESIDTVKAQLLPFLEHVASRPRATLDAENEGAPDRPEPPEEDGSGKKPKKGKPERVGGDGNVPGGPPDLDTDRLARLFKRYTLIYPTQTAWDSEARRVVRLPDIGALFGVKYLNAWKNSENKRVVIDERVVFDPSETVDAETHVNLFGGWPLEPKADDAAVQPVLRLLEYICGEAEASYTPITDWVLRWIALPLQKPGAKMATAIVMHGPDGAGKNLFWSVVAKIYGEYSTQIGQRELESQFNGWASRKLFILANEVVSPAEANQLVGQLKALVTEETIQVNEKGLPLRTEANLANFTFFSNNLVPLKVFGNDRRQMVIKTPHPHPDGKDFYAPIATACKAEATAQALYQYLLDLDLEDFGAHTKPMQTHARTDLIELSSTSVERFWREWKAGIVPLPYGPCMREDVYRAYHHWCRSNGERMPKASNWFSAELKAMNGLVHHPGVRVPRVTSWEGGVDAFEVNGRQRVLFYPAESPEAVVEGQVTREEWLRSACAEFTKAVARWLGESDRASMQ